MTQTSGPTTGPMNDTNASGLDRFFGWLRSIDLRRDGDDKWLAGVCSGIATRLGVDPIVIRAVLVLLVVMGGLGITVYLVAWAFLPNDKEDIVAERALRDGDVLGIILLLVIGLSLIGGTGFAGDVPGMGWIWWVALPVGLVVWLVTRKRNPAPASRDAAVQSSTWASVATTATTATATAPAESPTTNPPTAPYGAATPPGGGFPPAPPAARQPRPPKPPRAPKAPRRRSGGFGATLLIGGLAVAAYGLTSWAHQAGDWSGSDQTVGLCAALGVVGLGVLGLGLSGRRAGFTGFIAVVLTLVTWTASVVPDVTVGEGVGDRVWRPSATDTTSSYKLSVGSAELDLADAPDNPTTPRTIEARVGIGELRILVPENVTVEVRSSVGAGDITGIESSVSRDDFFNNNPDTVRDLSTVETVGTGTPDVIVDAHVGLGQILIGKE